MTNYKRLSLSPALAFVIRNSSFFRHSSLGIRHLRAAMLVTMAILYPLLSRPGFRHHCHYAILPRILLISAAVKDRKVCVVTYSRELNDSMAAVAVSSSGASKRMRP